MSGPEFFQTHMGRQFYEGTLPRLVTQVERLADGVARIADCLERGIGMQADKARGAGAPTDGEETSR